MSTKNTFVSETDTTYTFTAENMGEPMTFTIKKDFLEIANPEKVALFELMTVHNMQNHLHNTTGPAILSHKDQRVQYWMNGKEIPKSEAEKMIHDSNFNDKVLTTIGE